MQCAIPDTHTTLRGEVERIFFSSANFCAGRFLTKGGASVPFAGNVVPKENEPLVLHGKFVKHPKYGQQFEVASMEFDQRLDASGLANYLANNPDIKGIGPARARAVADQFGSDFDRALIETPEQIAEIARVPLSVIEGLRDRWLETSQTNAAMTALAAYGLTHHQVTKLVKKLGNNAVGIIERDPYVIVGEIDGFGFKRIDKIARQVGISKDNTNRIRAGIIFCVDEALDRGDCWVEYEELLTRSNTLLVMDCLDSRSRIESHLDNLIDQEALTCYSAECRFLVAKPAIRKMEETLASVFAEGRKANPHALSDASPPNAKLNLRQTQAVNAATNHSISLICGSAGSGKTFSISAIAEIYEEDDLSVVLCAPTGKAAKRIEESTGRPAQTIHRLLGFNGKTYSRDADNPISADVLIVDECSMVDVPLAWRLFQAVDLSRTAVVLVGDHNQLPPVGPGNILRDLIESKVLPTTILDEVVRQAGILKENSIAILRGEVPKTPQKDHADHGAWYVVDQHSNADEVGQFIIDLFKNTLPDKLGFDILRDVQVLTPTHKGPLGTMELNSRLQRLIQKKLWGNDIIPTPAERRPRLYVNDKVIQTRNNYDFGVMNGAMGIVRSVGSDGSLAIEFDGGVVHIEAGSPHRNDIQLAYALTIHKAQGSEFPCSIVVAHKSHSFMHHRNLLYTGVTRASKTAIIVGDRWGIANCAKRVQVDARKTFLSLLLAGGHE
ncbi:MAG: AAA family ATPase [Armatimonadetes bacterium]|nr:AAA family ATPase [Armatimonadota bacterium]